MKKWVLLVCGGMTCVTLAAAPVSSDNGTSSSPRSVPTVGMTKIGAREYYGEPFTKATSADGERWYYRLKFSEVYGRAFVPFYYDSPNVRWGYIDFGTDGRVKSWHWQHAAP